MKKYCTYFLLYVDFKEEKMNLTQTLNFENVVYIYIIYICTYFLLYVYVIFFVCPVMQVFFETVCFDDEGCE